MHKSRPNALTVTTVSNTSTSWKRKQQHSNNKKQINLGLQSFRVHHVTLQFKNILHTKLQETQRGLLGGVWGSGVGTVNSNFWHINQRPTSTLTHLQETTSKAYIYIYIHTHTDIKTESTHIKSDNPKHCMHANTLQKLSTLYWWDACF